MERTARCRPCGALCQDPSHGLGFRLYGDIDIAAGGETRPDADGEAQGAVQIRIVRPPAQAGVDDTGDQGRIQNLAHRQGCDPQEGVLVHAKRAVHGIGRDALEPGGPVLHGIIERHAAAQDRHVQVAHQQRGNPGTGQGMADRRRHVVCSEYKDRLWPEARQHLP